MQIRNEEIWEQKLLFLTGEKRRKIQGSVAGSSDDISFAGIKI